MKTQNKIKAFLERKFGIDRHSISAKIKSFQLGYRYGLIVDYDNQMIGGLIEEILSHAQNPKLLSAFSEGKMKAQKERKLVEKSLEQEAKRIKELELLVEEEVKQEVEELQEVRDKNQDKSKDKSR